MIKKKVANLSHIVILGWLWHKLNYIQLSQNVQKKFNPFNQNFQKHIEVVNYS